MDPPACSFKFGCYVDWLDPFTNPNVEQYTLLTEILKKAGVPSMHLVKMIKDFRISPSWTDIPLPPGMTLAHLSIFSDIAPCHLNVLAVRWPSWEFTP